MVQTPLSVSGLDSNSLAIESRWRHSPSMPLMTKSLPRACCGWWPTRRWWSRDILGENSSRRVMSSAIGLVRSAHGRGGSRSSYRTPARKWSALARATSHAARRSRGGPQASATTVANVGVANRQFLHHDAAGQSVGTDAAEILAPAPATAAPSARPCRERRPARASARSSCVGLQRDRFDFAGTDEAAHRVANSNLLAGVGAEDCTNSDVYSALDARTRDHARPDSRSSTTLMLLQRARDHVARHENCSGEVLVLGRGYRSRGTRPFPREAGRQSARLRRCWGGRKIPTHAETRNPERSPRSPERPAGPRGAWARRRARAVSLPARTCSSEVATLLYSSWTSPPSDRCAWPGRRRDSGKWVDHDAGLDRQEAPVPCGRNCRCRRTRS